MMQRALNRVAGRVRLMVGRCILEAINSGTKVQSVQIQLLAGEVRENVEHFQPYGYSSVPHPGAEGISLAVGGSSDHQVVIVIDDRRYRLTGLADGEVALYSDEGDKVVLKRGRNIEVTAGTQLTVISPLSVFTGDVDIGGNLVVDGSADVGSSISAGTTITAGTSVTAPTVSGTSDVMAAGKSGKNHRHTSQGEFAITTPPN